MGRTIWKYIGIGILVDLGAMFFAELAGDFFNGMSWGDAAVLGGILYLCILIVVCTGVLLHHMDKNHPER